MTGSSYLTRLAATAATVALLVSIIVKPDAGRDAVEQARIVATSFDDAPAATRPCPIGESVFRGPFAPIEDVLTVSPLGGVTAPGEALPAPYIRINTERGDTVFERRVTQVLAPGRADIVAIERKTDRDDAGRVRSLFWTVHFKACDEISFYYDGIDALDPSILTRAGGVEAFTELGGPDHLALTTRMRVRTGEKIGTSDGFDVGLHDDGAAPSALEAPERYVTNPYPRAEVLGVKPQLLKAISHDTVKARCAIDYLADDLRVVWEEKLGDAWGVRRARGENACRTAIADEPGAARGVWFTDAAHNAATSKVSAIALSPDAVDPDRLIFALHGRLTSLSADMIALPPMSEQSTADKATNGFLSFKQGDGRINTAFENVQDDETYCYERLRTNFVGPAVNGVVLLRRETAEEGPVLLKIEATNAARRCNELEEPWAFSGNETVFYR